MEFRFAGRPAKQIWITAGKLPLVENILYAFSLAEVEVYDAAGKNVALATCGTGVTVNSTHHSPGQELAAHRWYWPLHYDAGFKWARVGYHDDPINWHWVEKEKGVLKIDPETDAAVTELAAHGVEIVMSLNFGNRLYSGPASRPIPQLWEWNYDMPAPPTTPEALAAWTRYVEFMVKHFRDRVKHFEIWNEWNISCYWGAVPSLEHYLAVARAAIPVIRKHAPEAKIMMGSWAGFPHGISTWSPAQLAAKEKELSILQATRELAREVDEIGWHPFYQTDPERLKDYTADVRALRALAPGRRLPRALHGHGVELQRALSAALRPSKPPRRGAGASRPRSWRRRSTWPRCSPVTPRWGSNRSSARCTSRNSASST